MITVPHRVRGVLRRLRQLPQLCGCAAVTAAGFGVLLCGRRHGAGWLREMPSLLPERGSDLSQLLGSQLLGSILAAIRRTGGSGMACNPAMPMQLLRMVDFRDAGVAHTTGFAGMGPSSQRAARKLIVLSVGPVSSLPNIQRRP